MADGGRQLRSVTFLADPVISISRQVLKSSWKPAWRQPRQQLPRGILGLSARPALVCRGGGWLAQSATCCWSLFLEDIGLLLGSSDAHTWLLPWCCSRAQSVNVHQSQRAPCRKHKKAPYSIAINSTCSQSCLQQHCSHLHSQQPSHGPDSSPCCPSDLEVTPTSQGAPLTLRFHCSPLFHLAVERDGLQTFPCSGKWSRIFFPGLIFLW